MKTLLRIRLACLIAICSLQVQAQQANDQIAGSWHGTLNVGSEIRLVFNLSLNEDLSWNATLDSPDQGAMDIPLGEVSLTGDSIRIGAPIVNGYYIGKFASETIINGEWHQNALSLPLELEKKEGTIVIMRPQEPQPPFPYMEEEVSFQNSEQGFALGGTLSLPEGDGPFPAVVLITGSGSQNRDEEIFGHKPFKLIADYLTRNGIAVLRYDDRGVGASGGNAAGSTSGDLAGDARAAFDFLLSRSDIVASKIGIIGHSEGGMIAFMLASSQKNIAFIISLAGPGVDGRTILLDQSEYISRLSGVSEPVVVDNRIVMDEVYNLIAANEAHNIWEEKVIEFTSSYYLNESTASYSEEDIGQIQRNLLASIPEPAYAWIRYFIMFDPAPLFGSITCPVLALNGEKDCQALAENNINAIKMGLQASGNKQVTTMILPGLNHLFQNCETGLLNEYGIIEETFDQKTLEIMWEWIGQQLD